MLEEVRKAKATNSHLRDVAGTKFTSGRIVFILGNLLYSVGAFIAGQSLLDIIQLNADSHRLQ